MVLLSSYMILIKAHEKLKVGAVCVVILELNSISVIHIGGLHTSAGMCIKTLFFRIFASR